MTELPKLDRSLGPTPGATKFYRELAPANKALNVPTYNFGQGAEVDQPGGKIAAILAEPIATKTTPTYPTNGGTDAMRDSMANWAKRFFAIPATKTNTFVFGTQGRASLMTVFLLLNHEVRSVCVNPTVLIGNTHWPMLDQHMKFAGMGQKQYAMTQDNFPKVIFDHLDADLNGNIVCVYVNSPDNPTGLRRTRAEIAELMTGLEAINKKRHERGQVICSVLFDTPYFMACEQRAAPSLLDAGFDGVLDDEAITTPWFINISFSKAYGFATPGLHTVMTHPRRAKHFGDMVNTVYGNSLEIGFAEKVTRILQPELDTEALAHFKMLKDKYTANKKILAGSFGDFIVAGDPNMTALLDLPSDLFGHDVEGKRVKKTYAIRDMNDFLEYCGHEKGIVFVNNGGTLARIAMAMHSDEFAKGVALFREAFDVLLAAAKSKVA